MNLADVIRSLADAFAHRLRATLTLLGIAIGSGSIVLVASLIHGGEAFLARSSQELTDEDIVQVRERTPPPDQQNRTSRPLSRHDADAISEAREGTLVAAESSRETMATYRQERKRVAVVSSGPSTLSLYRLHVALGRELDANDRIAGRRTCLIGQAIHEDLLGNAPLSDTLRISVDGRLFDVVGVLAKKPTMGGGEGTYSWNRKVLIPETTYDALYAPTHQVQKVYARTGRGPASVAFTRAVVESILLERHLGVSNFILSKDPSGGMMALILNVIHVLLMSTGVLTLVASGINIMNVMLVTVTERTREIGLRRALGATPRSILLQFLAEAATLSLIGSLAGVLGGALVAWLVALGARSGLGDWEIVIRGWSVGLGVGLAVVMGLVFGILPAWRASRVSPIDALRAD